MFDNKIIISKCGRYHIKDNKPLYKKRFIKVLQFHSPNLAPVYDASGAYHIKFNGEPAYNKKFNKVFGFYCDKAAIMYENKYYHINFNGDKFYKNYYDWVGNYQENKSVVKKDNKFFHIDIEGNIIYSEKYDYAGDFKDDCSVVYLDKKSSHINKEGQLIHNTWYKKLGIFHKGYAIAEDEVGYFHINIEGNPLYNARYKMVEPFYNDYALVETFSGTLERINNKGNIEHVIYQPDTIAQMHKISSELVGFWNTYLINAACQIGLLELLPADINFLTKKLQVDKSKLHRFLRALWDINLISYNKKQNIWQLNQKGQFFVDYPFMFKIAKMWGFVISEKKWLEIPQLLKQEKISSFLSFKTNEKNNRIKTELYQALIEYAKFDTIKFPEKIYIDASSNVLLFGVSALALVNILRNKKIKSISYYNHPILPKELTNDFAINFIDKKKQLMNKYDTVIFVRFLQHQDDKKTLSYLRRMKDSNISRILVIETIIDDYDPLGGAIDINIMIETDGILRNKNNWEDILKNVGNFSIKHIVQLTNYLSVIDIRKK